MTVDTIGFIGLGNMGNPMVEKLVQSGRDVRAFDLSSTAMKVAEAVGATIVRSPAEAADGASMLILMLPDSSVVESVLSDLDLVRVLRNAATVVDMSSSEPHRTRALAAELAARGVLLVDAPVSGGVRGARNATLTVMAGGPSEVVERVRPVLAVFGRVVPTGQIGSGHAIKALNNLLSATHLWATSEAIAIGQRFGVDPDVLLSVVNTSTGRSVSTEVKWPNFIRTGTFDSGFAMRLMVKDVRIAIALAEQTGTACPLSDEVAQLWAAAATSMPADADHTEIATWVMRGGDRE